MGRGSARASVRGSARASARASVPGSPSVRNSGSATAWPRRRVSASGLGRELAAGSTAIPVSASACSPPRRPRCGRARVRSSGRFRVPARRSSSPRRCFGCRGGDPRRRRTRPRRRRARPARHHGPRPSRWRHCGSRRGSRSPRGPATIADGPRNGGLGFPRPPPAQPPRKPRNTPRAAARDPDRSGASSAPPWPALASPILKQQGPRHRGTPEVALRRGSPVRFMAGLTTPRRCRSRLPIARSYRERTAG